MAARAAATRILLDVLAHGEALDGAIEAHVAAIDSPRDRALTRELCYGVLRWLPRLECLARDLLSKPPAPRDRDLEILILLGLYQLIYTRIPDHAALAQTVALARKRGKGWATGLVNGVLRRFSRERESLLARADRHDEARYAHPPWLLATLRQAWPNDWRRVVTGNNQRAPMTLRVNRRRATRESYLERLAARGIEAHAVTHTTHGVALHSPIDVECLPGFKAGVVSVQDGAAQLAARILDPAPGERVLDACAAPGGKTAHLLEAQPAPGTLLAVERSAKRMGRLKATLTRLGLTATTRIGDATDTGRWWDGTPFDRILLDAPCSATGVIRRHPDIKHHRRPEDLERLGSRQRALLAALWPLVADGGGLLYATCSVLPQENEIIVADFVSTHRDAAEQPIAGTFGRACGIGRQILPGEDGMDGFYYALLAKR